MFNPKATRKFITGLASGVVTALALGIPATSQAITWDLTTCSNGITCTGNSGQRTFTASGETVTIQAFRTTNNNGTGLFQNDYLGFYSGGGLGVENASAPEHAVDNTGRDELIVFRFSNSNYTPVSAGLNSIATSCFFFFCNYGDTDIDVWIGGNGKSFSDFTNLSYDSLATNGFSQCTSGNSGGTSDRNAAINTCNYSGEYLIIGADHSNSDVDDYFKISSLTANAGPIRAPGSTVPEPSAMILFGIGLIGLRALRNAQANKMQQLPVKAN